MVAKVVRIYQKDNDHWKLVKLRNVRYQFQDIIIISGTFVIVVDEEIVYQQGPIEADDLPPLELP